MSSNTGIAGSTATMELRMEEREVIRGGVTQRIRILQQMHVLSDDTTTWRDVPLVRLPYKPRETAKAD